MNKLNTLLVALLLALFAPLAGSGPIGGGITHAVHADLPCTAGGKVAESSNHSVEVHSSDHGCRQHPSANLTVRVGGTDRYVAADVPDFEKIFVSDSGRTLLLVGETLRGDRDGFVVYRDGYRLGAYTLSDVLGADSRTVSEGRYVKVRIDGLQLVIDDVDGTEVDRRYLGTLAYNRNPRP